MKNRWYIALKWRTEAIFDLSGLHPIDAPEGCYWADPFVAEEGHSMYLFFEDYDYVKGRISMGEVRDLGGTPELFETRVVLEEPHHLSFPSVTKIDGEWYMTPEAVLSGELWIYKARAFPLGWYKFAKVASGRYDDPVMRKINNGYEIWTSTDGDKRRVFRSKSIAEGWELVSSEDGQYERMAGHWIANNTIRPVQDSYPVYGRAIKFKDANNKVVRSVEPDWAPNLTGTHTFSTSEHLVAVDGRVRLEE